MTKLTAPPLSRLKLRKSEKWQEFPSDVLPLPVAEMDFEIAEPIQIVLQEMIRGSDTGYLGPIPELAKNLGKFASTRWGWSIDPEQVFVVTDVGVGMVEMGRMLLNPGNKVMINSPVYHNMANWITELKCQIFDAPLIADGLSYQLDFSAIELGYKSGVKVHFLCNPHNPVGAVFTKAELAKIAELAKTYDVIVFSDEIHAPLTYVDSKFTPFLAASEVAREVGVCITAASKSWNLAGLKCATVITAHVKTLALAKSMPQAVHYRASLFGAMASATAYECVEWLDSAVETMDSNRKFLAALIGRELPGVGFRVPDCSYLAWLDLSALKLGPNPAEIILEQAKLALNPGITYGPNSGQFVRLNFATSEEIIEEAISRISSLASKG